MSVQLDDTRSITSGGTLPYPAVHERLMTELESSEGQLGAIIRSLYDDNEQDEFLSSLVLRIKQHDKDIERMCNKNYQGFIESVTQLVKVKSEAHKLKNKIIEANHTVQDSGRELLKQTEDLRIAREIQKNISATIETLTLCIPVLEMYGKLQDLMENRQFYSALKTLEQLEHIYLPRVRGYIFSESLAEEIPAVRKKIEDHSTSELKEYLTTIRQASEKIGEVAMHLSLRMTRLYVSEDVKHPINMSKEELESKECAQDIVDFSPVYRCLHIHSVLGRRDKFVEEYRTHRMQQLRLLIKPPSKAENISDFKQYFYNVIGFFVVEDTIMHTCQTIGVGHKTSDVEGLVSQSALDDFWDMATSEMLSVLRQHCLHCSNTHLLLKIKQLVVWFCHTVTGYGYKGDRLYEVSLEIREHYDDLLMKNTREAFTNLLESDDYKPVTVDTEPQFQGVLELFPFKDLSIQRSSYPKTFPFSSMVLQVFRQMKSFVDECADYSDKLNLSRTEIDEGVRKSVNILLTKCMSGCLSNLINGKLTIQQLSQLWVNIDQWESSEKELDSYIATVTKVPKSNMANSRLYGFSAFKDAKLMTQDKIEAVMAVQISELMEGVAYDWTPKEKHVAKTPSSSLEDVLRLMKSTFDIFTILPTGVIDSICIQAIQTLIGLMERILLNENVPRINLDGLRNFKLDLNRCEEFVRGTASMMVPSLRPDKVPNLPDAMFGRLQQLITMFETGDWTTYISELNNIGHKKYPAVTPDSVVNLLAKLRAYEKKKKKRTFPGKPNPVKVALHALQEHLQEKLTTYSTLGSRLPFTEGRSPSISRGSPILYRRRPTTESVSSLNSN